MNSQPEYTKNYKPVRKRQAIQQKKMDKNKILNRNFTKDNITNGNEAYKKAYNDTQFYFSSRKCT